MYKNTSVYEYFSSLFQNYFLKTIQKLRQRNSGTTYFLINLKLNEKGEKFYSLRK